MVSKIFKMHSKYCNKTHLQFPSTDSFQTILLEMRSEVDNLTERLNSATDENLRNENETLKKHIKAEASLINALQQGVDSSTKLYKMMESSVQRQVEESEKMKSELSKKKCNIEERARRDETFRF